MIIVAGEVVIQERFPKHTLFFVDKIFLINNESQERQREIITNFLNKFSSWSNLKTLWGNNRGHFRAKLNMGKRTTVFNVSVHEFKNGCIKISVYNDSSRTEHSKEEIEEFLSKLSA